ncbi:uncharacterized protein LOC132734712 [Ruditapes philippinarum]|uniref:uncharacterized protein LOC132734712 n=1 Tax=Ruditapes philippinarum TaxID=129788 RepID=UPI00295AF772|nr:uncharacterized protein LOC132734712 [Ruditapes philippinarum]
MEFSFALTLFFLVIADSKSQEMTPWGSVQISTCDVPLFDTPFSICCYTENLPNDTIIYFSNNFGHVAKIKPQCRYGVEQHSDNMTSNCKWIGNMKVYYLTIHGKFLQDYADVTFECGYFVRKRELKITVLDNHTTSVFLPGSSPVLYFKLQNGLASNIRLYLLQTNVTLLEVDQENNVNYHDNDVTFNGNVHQNNFSAKILNLQRQRNGTYVCEYTIDDDTTMRDGITVVVLRKPKAPEIRNTTWEVFGNGISGTLTCEGTSDFAAPPFYKPAIAANLMTEWIIPSENYWKNISYFSSINGSSANISFFDCKEYLMPIYCKVSEKSLVSDKSIGFDPEIMCSELRSAEEHKEIVFLIVLGVTMLLMIAFSATVAFLNRKRIQAWRRQKIPSLIDGLPSERDFRSDEVQQALEQIAMEESRQKYELHGGQSTGSVI